MSATPTIAVPTAEELALYNALYGELDSRPETDEDVIMEQFVKKWRGTAKQMKTILAKVDAYKANREPANQSALNVIVKGLLGDAKEKAEFIGATDTVNIVYRAEINTKAAIQRLWVRLINAIMTGLPDAKRLQMMVEMKTEIGDRTKAAAITAERSKYTDTLIDGDDLKPFNTWYHRCL